MTDKLPTKWGDYLLNDDNKRELFPFLSKSLLETCEGLQMVTNVGSEIKSSGPSTSSLVGSSAKVEEADGRIILHLQVRLF